MPDPAGQRNPSRKVLESDGSPSEHPFDCRDRACACHAARKVRHVKHDEAACPGCSGWSDMPAHRQPAGTTG